jgi:hypothetical protein
MLKNIFNVGIDLRSEIFGVYSDYPEHYDNITKVDQLIMANDDVQSGQAGMCCTGDTCWKLIRWAD